MLDWANCHGREGLLPDPNLRVPKLLGWVCFGRARFVAKLKLYAVGYAAFVDGKHTHITEHRYRRSHNTYTQKHCGTQKLLLIK